jgi:putative SOS response-associated peptidase YedK
MVEGYYEWKELDLEGKKKQPYFIKPKEKLCIYLAGLYREIKNEEVIII